MRTMTVILASLAMLTLAPLTGCVQSDEEYLAESRKSGLTQDVRDRQSRRSSYDFERFSREQEDAARDR
ncbi:hypothetical protein N825_18625 [Skermanella stibiiresistens SB22]|uniref:Lipoxygenase domain-containing protein n=1 Tax=Skermanella stibiiresistens SB22 TaxID=1385369 RepID=W9H8F9_9PROT|nr:hypothetical protein [Skermanella stibiiresistens]EWY42309.1 hypothetical protein N825_18625 [Skermanella stibiiresistens SB22]